MKRSRRGRRIKMTRLQLRNLIRKRLGETTAAFWTDVELNQWIDNAGHDTAYKLKYIKRNGLMDVTSASEYALSGVFPNWLAVLRVYHYDGTNWNKLKQTNEDRLDVEQEGWKNAVPAIPQHYYADRERDVLGLYAPPNDVSQGIGRLQIQYANDFTDLTGDGELTGIPWGIQLAMAEFVVATGYETRGWGDKANDAWGKYTAKLQHYHVERDTEKQVDDEGLVMKNYRNIR